MRNAERIGLDVLEAHRRRRSDLIDHLIAEHGAEDCWAAFPALAQLMEQHRAAHRIPLPRGAGRACSHEHDGSDQW